MGDQANAEASRWVIRLRASSMLRRIAYAIQTQRSPRILLQLIGTAFDRDALQTQRLAREFNLLGSQQFSKSCQIRFCHGIHVSYRPNSCSTSRKSRVCFASLRHNFFQPRTNRFLGWGVNHHGKQPPTCGVNKIASRPPDRRVVFLAAGGGKGFEYNAQ